MRDFFNNKVKVGDWVVWPNWLRITTNVGVVTAIENVNTLIVHGAGKQSGKFELNDNVSYVLAEEAVLANGWVTIELENLFRPIIDKLIEDEYRS